jgi:hypothetical protein
MVSKPESTGTGFTSTITSSTVALLIVIGAILFLFPEPATSAFGIFLLALAVLLWFLG